MGRKKKEVYFVEFSFLFEGKGVGNWNSKEREKRGNGLCGSVIKVEPFMVRQRKCLARLPKVAGYEYD